MNSIDNLRRYALTGAAVSSTTRAVLAGYVDEIEREVKALTDERDLLKRQWEAGVDFDQRLEECSDNREDVTLFGVDYTALPLDADGVPIHVGDVVAATLAHGGSGRWVVDRMELTRAYNQDLWQIALDKDGACWVTPSTVRHHHAPTVEDVLREFAQEMNENLGMYTGEAIDADEWHEADERTIAEYAEKLRLAGEE